MNMFSFCQNSSHCSFNVSKNRVVCGGSKLLYGTLLLFFHWCRRKSFTDVTRHCYILFLSASSLQLRKLSKLVLENRVMLSKSAFPNSSVDVNIFYKGAWQWLHVLKCLWGFWMLMALKLCWYFHKCASLPLSVLFLLVLVELGVWKVLPALIRRCHCVENLSLYNAMIFGKRALQSS